jgi:hypothetical protein
MCEQHQRKRTWGFRFSPTDAAAPSAKMPSYRIIGDDQEEYGPVSAEQIRQWITEAEP